MANTAFAGPFELGREETEIFIAKIIKDGLKDYLPQKDNPQYFDIKSKDILFFEETRNIMVVISVLNEKYDFKIPSDVPDTDRLRVYFPYFSEIERIEIKGKVKVKVSMGNAGRLQMFNVYVSDFSEVCKRIINYVAEDQVEKTDPSDYKIGVSSRDPILIDEDHCHPYKH